MVSNFNQTCCFQPEASLVSLSRKLELISERNEFMIEASIILLILSIFEEVETNQ
jgi:hypothetical protein